MTPQELLQRIQSGDKLIRLSYTTTDYRETDYWYELENEKHYIYYRTVNILLDTGQIEFREVDSNYITLNCEQAFIIQEKDKQKS
jgi:hypothetical protein